MAKWGDYKQTPHTYVACDMKKFIPGMKAGVVSFPMGYRTGGVLAWAVLSHEVSGHHLLHSVDGLIQKIQNQIRTEISPIHNSDIIKKTLANYWAGCAEEAASDVLGVLGMGPSFGFGLIGYLKNFRGKEQLHSYPIQIDDVHPIDVLRKT